MRINNICQTYLSIVSFICFVIFSPGIAHSACGNIPSTYPLFSSSEIKLEKDISVNGNPVIKATKSPNAVIDANGSFSNNVSQSLPDLDPSSFPANSATDHNHLSIDTTFNHTTETYFKDIKLQSTGIAVTFTGGGPFHIDELKTEKENNTINFAAGTYYIKKFKTQKKGVTINVTSSPVIIHIGEEFKTEEENVSFNNSGSVDDFIVYLHSGAKVEFKKKNVDFTGLIYGPSNVEKVSFEEKDVTFRGAIIVSGGKIETKKETNSFTYSSTDQTRVGNISTCAVRNPTVTNLSTTDTTPILTGTLNSADSAGGFTVTVNSINYTLAGNLELTNSGDDWILDLSNISPLSPGTYDVAATSNNGAGRILSDSSSNELVITVAGACETIPAGYPLYSSTKIKLHKTISVNGNSVSGEKSPGAIDANGNFSNNISQTLPALDPGSFPINTEINGDHNHLTIDTTYNHTTEKHFRDIKLQEEDVAVTFTGGGPFHIGELKTEEEGNIINFAAGTYYINKFETAKKNVIINVTSSPVIIHIGEKFKTKEENVNFNTVGADLNINTQGNVDDFIVYLHSGAKVEFKKKNVRFTGVIYGPSNVEKVIFEEEDISFHGAIIVSGGTIETKKETNTFTYTTADQTAVGNIELCQGGGGGGGDTPATNFNCVEKNADGISGKLYTKTTAQSFSFDIVALQDASTIETSFASGTDHTVTLDLVDVSNGTCETNSAINLTFPSPPSSPVPPLLTFTSFDSGVKTSFEMQSGTAYSTVKCRVTDTTDNASVIGCSTDSFAIRPTSFSVTSSDLQTINPPTSSAATTKAGETFSLEFNGYIDMPNKIDDTKIAAHPGAIRTGQLSGSLANDRFTGDFTYSEVGWFLLDAEAIYDDIFTDVDQSADCTNDFSNTPDADGKVGCKFGNTANPNYFGRFTPDHFEITDFQDGIFSNACTGFTYNGQAFSYQTAPTLTITAYSLIPTITNNYTGAYRKLSATDFNVTPPTTDKTQMGADGSTLVNIQSWTPASATLTDNMDGSPLIFAFANDSYVYQHEDNSKIAAFTPTVDLEFTDITDSDGIQTQGLPHTIQASGSSIRFGRLTIENTHGSELLPLAVPVYTEYYNGTSFVVNTNDTCTPINVSQLSFNGGTNPIPVGSGTSTASIANSPFALGKAGLSLSAPGANNTGFVDIISDIFISSFPWLGYDWDGDGSHDNSASARATFGIYKGNSQQIYFREVY